MWKRKKYHIVGLAIVTMGLSATFTAHSFIREIRAPRLPVLGQIQDFSLINSQGMTFGLKDLKGRVWIADFFFTTCGDICPLMSKNMAALHRSLELVGGTSLVSITVNPEVDSPAVLARYSQNYRANETKWHFLTGPREKIKALAVNSFRIGSVEEPIFHSSKLVLVDRHGLIRGYYEGTDRQQVNQLFKDISRLLKEKS